MEILNRKARYDYFIEDTIEAGIVLTGTEIKSLKEGKANIKDSYAIIRNGEIYLLNTHISSYEKELRKYAINKLKSLDNIIIYNETADAGIITINVKGVFPQDEASYLNSKGICVRSGEHCAKLLKDLLKTVGTVRISFYFYNTFEEIDTLYEALKNGGDFLDAYFN